MPCVCAPAYLGRKPGEVARTRTTVLQAHSHYWLGTFGGAGNGDYRGELARACEAIISYAGWLCMPLSHILVRLDGLYGTTAVLIELLSSGMGVIVRSKEYGLLDLPAVAGRLSQPPDHQSIHPESGASRALFDCPDIALRPSGPCVRLIVATYPTTSTTQPSIGMLRAGTVYELFLTTAPQAAFTCADGLDLYLHRGAFETVLSDEDLEQDTDRWCSRTACGQEFWQIVNQWLDPRGLRRSDDALPSLSSSRTVSRSHHDEEATTSQCCALASCSQHTHPGSAPSSPCSSFLRTRKFASSPSTRSSPSPLGRLATLSASPSLDSSAAHTNGHSLRWLSSLRRASACHLPGRADPSTTSALASLVA